MRRFWINAEQLAAKLGVSVKSIRRAYRKGEIPVDRFCRFVRGASSAERPLLKSPQTLSSEWHGPRERA